MNFSDLIKLHEAGLTIERIVIAPDGSISVEFAPVSKARTMAERSTAHRRVGRPPKVGRRRKRGRPRKSEAA